MLFKYFFSIGVYNLNLYGKGYKSKSLHKDQILAKKKKFHIFGQNSGIYNKKKMWKKTKIAVWLLNKFLGDRRKCTIYFAKRLNSDNFYDLLKIANQTEKWKTRREITPWRLKKVINQISES